VRRSPNGGAEIDAAGALARGCEKHWRRGDARLEVTLVDGENPAAHDLRAEGGGEADHRRGERRQ